MRSEDEADPNYLSSLQTCFTSEVMWLGNRRATSAQWCHEIMIHKVARMTLFAFLGYLLIAILQTLFLEVLLDGQVAPEASIGILMAGLAGTVVSGIVGGYAAAWMGGKRPWLQCSVVLVPLFLDTLFVIGQMDGGHPLWFNLGGSATLMAATVGGGWLRARTMARSAD